ncbi:hypothetical protein FRC08_005560 [Ceratobasidium sp. 394]|nr:hypothetical protein FRC08_005560 [Ceratobasidium sp. 394]
MTLKAPEILNGSAQLSKESDVYALGMLKRIKQPPYFIVYQNIYFFDSLWAIHRVDDSGQYHRVDLENNPPLVKTPFSIDGISFLLNNRGGLLYNKLDGEWWHWKRTYPDLESARAEITRSAKKGSTGSGGKNSTSDRPDPRHKPEDLKDPMYFLVGATSKFILPIQRVILH